MPARRRPGQAKHLWQRICAGAVCVCVWICAETPGIARALDLPPAVQGGAIARDPASGRIFVTLPSSNTVVVLDGTGRHVLTILMVPPSPMGLAIDPVRHIVYVACDQSGMISAFDERTYRLARIYLVGGHPSGVALLDGGRGLLFTDAVSGAVNTLTTSAQSPRSRQVLSFGPGSLPRAAPRAAAIGQPTILWASGFAPGEPVDVYWVYWGAAPLARTTANSAGFVTVAVKVPPKVDLGDHLVILYGKRSTVSQSVLMTVVPPPVVPRRRVAPRPAGTLPPLIRHLLAPSVAVPNLIAGLLSHTPKGKRPAPRPMIQIPLIALALAPLLALAARAPGMRRRRRRRAEEKPLPQKKKGRGRRSGSSTMPVKRAS